MPFKKRKVVRRKKAPTKRRRLFASAPKVGYAPPVRFPSAPGGMGNVVPEAALESLLSNNGLPIGMNNIRSKAVDTALDGLATALSASKASPLMKTAGAATMSAVKQKIQNGRATTTATSPPKAHSSEKPTVVSESLGVSQKGLNNALVPDKFWSLDVYKEKVTPREKKFYDQWPEHELLIYQSKIHGRLLHTASPGHKSYWHPFNTLLPIPTVFEVRQYRRGVEQKPPDDATQISPYSEPPFLVNSALRGTVQGGQDYTYNLHLGGYQDFASSVSAMLVGDVYDLNAEIPDATLKFGTFGQKLEWHIENYNKFFPANFTIQVHEYLGSQPNATFNGNPPDPVDLLLYSQAGKGQVKSSTRGFRTYSTALIPNSGDSATYTQEEGLLYNAPTIGGNSRFKDTFKTVSSRTIKLTAGGRLKCSLNYRTTPFNLYELTNVVNPNDDNNEKTLRKGQVFVTILAQGTNEVIGDVYEDGDYQYSANYMTNPVQYAVTNIRKTAKIRCPGIVVRTNSTPDYVATNPSVVNFASSLVAFGEKTQAQFVPVGKYDTPYDQVKDEPAPTGSSVIIPVMTNQQEGSAGARGNN